MTDRVTKITVRTADVSSSEQGENQGRFQALLTRFKFWGNSQAEQFELNERKNRALATALEAGQAKIEAPISEGLRKAQEAEAARLANEQARRHQSADDRIKEAAAEKAESDARRSLIAESIETTNAKAANIELLDRALDVAKKHGLAIDVDAAGNITVLGKSSVDLVGTGAATDSEESPDDEK